MQGTLLQDQRQFQRQAEESRTLGDTSSYQELIFLHSQEVVRDSMYHIWQVTQTKSGQVPEKSTEQ